MWYKSKTAVVRKGRGNREVLLAMLSPWLELENTHIMLWHASVLFFPVSLAALGQGTKHTAASWDGMGCCQRHGRKIKG